MVQPPGKFPLPLACVQTKRCQTPHPLVPIPEPALVPKPHGTHSQHSPRACALVLVSSVPIAHRLEAELPQSQTRLLARSGGRMALSAHPHPPESGGRISHAPLDSCSGGLPPQSCAAVEAWVGDQLGPASMPESLPSLGPW